MPLLEQNRDLIFQQAQQAAADRKAAQVTYREILLRRKAPNDGDLAAIQGALERLGLTMADVETDAAALDEHDRIVAERPTAMRIQQLQQALDAARDARHREAQPFREEEEIARSRRMELARTGSTTADAQEAKSIDRRLLIIEAELNLVNVRNGGPIQDARAALQDATKRRNDLKWDLFDLTKKHPRVLGIAE